MSEHNLDILGARVEDLTDMMGEVRGDMKTVLGVIGRFPDFDRIATDHETRLRRLEQTMWKAAGFATLAGALGGVGLKALAQTLGG